MPAIRPTASISGCSTSTAKNNNPKGKNQHKDCPPSDDPRIPELLAAYHRRNITDRKRLSALLREEHGIVMSESTIARRKRELGLRASGRTTSDLADSVKRQLVKDQMDKDQTGRIGAKTVKARIFEETGIDLTRDWIRNEMRVLAPAEFASRRPRHKAPKSSETQAQASSSPQNQGGTAATQQRPHLHNPTSPLPTFNAPPAPYDDSDSENDPLPPLLFEPQQQQRRPVETIPSPYRPPPTISPPAPLRQSTTTPAPSIPAVLDILSREAPKMITLTRLLGAVDVEQLREFGQAPSSAYADVIKYMEAAALLERQLSRFASGLRADGGVSRP